MVTMKVSISRFTGPYQFLSNFYPCEVHFEGIVYPSVEHAYQAAKTTDPDIRAKMARVETAAQVKAVGRTLEHRPDWDDNLKLTTMEHCLREKFLSDHPANEPLKKKLLNTASFDLVEGNTWGDIFWGVCDGVGLNHLGNLLMTVRRELAVASV